MTILRKLTRLASVPQGSASAHLDMLRGIAAFGVLLNHWRDACFVDLHSGALKPPLVIAAYLICSFGRQWVSVFFVMSGFLIGGSILRAFAGDRWSWRDYLLKRLTRLYVVLLPALLLGGILDWSGMHLLNAEDLYAGKSGMISLTNNVHDSLTFQTLFGNLFFVQNIALPGAAGTVVHTFGTNGPLWSLNCEFWYYMAFPLLALLLSKRSTNIIRIASIVCLAVWCWFVGGWIAWMGVSWLAGVLIVYLPPVAFSSGWKRTATIIAVLCLFICCMVMNKIRPGILSDLLLNAAVVILIWQALQKRAGTLPATYARVAQRCARSSYTTYLVHFPMIIFLKALWNVQRTDLGWKSGIVSMALLLTVIVYAQAIYEIFEKNTDKIRNWIKPYILRAARG